MAKPWEVTLTIRDDKGKIGYAKVMFQSADFQFEDGFNSFEAIEDTLDELVPLIDSMINGVIVRITISRETRQIAGLKNFPLSGADVEEKAIFIFRTSEGKPRVTLPTIKDSLIVDGGDVIDQSDPDVSLFIFMMIDGSGTSMEFRKAVDNRNNEITGFENAYERFISS